VIEPGKITTLLQSAGNGDLNAYNRLFPLVYDHLRALAQAQLNRVSGDLMVNRTELIHEMYLRLIDQTMSGTNDRAHFYALAARAMRHIMVDHYRKSHAGKRGGDHVRVPVHEELIVPELTEDHIVALHELMEQLRDIDERLYTVVDLRFFAGLTIEEIAEMLQISTSTVDRDWKKARGWLYRQLINE
jgi:RNA polymerase sigma factor (TIGR02999 family)